MPKASVKVSVKEKTSKWKNLRDVMKFLDEKDLGLYVGVLEEGGGDDVREGGLTNAAIAAIHEFGSADGRIPERSFIRSTFAAKEAEYMSNLRAVLSRVVEGRISIDQALGLLGTKIATDIKKKITDGPGIPPPNAPETVARKGSDRPLIDTGRMMNSITYAVRRGKE